MKRHHLVTAAILLAVSLPLLAQTLRERPLINIDDDTSDSDQITLPAGVKLIRDVKYGKDDFQTFDVYIPQNAHNSPVIFMVHGGEFWSGDKSNTRVVQNKLNHFAAQGFVFISTNNRLLPHAKPLDQAEDVARALATAQKQARTWNADPKKFILMGHSAGAHLVDLLSSNRRQMVAAGAKPIKGTISLDADSLNVPKIMQSSHATIYYEVFTSNPPYWYSVSPYHRLQFEERTWIKPFLLVCSSHRRDSCAANRDFADKVKSFGNAAEVLEEDLSHGEINMNLGLPGAYTDAVDTFINSLLKK